MIGEPSIHRIDEADRITFVDPVWLDFARENGSDLTLDAVRGQPLWRFIAGAETTCLYRLILLRVREHGRSVRVPFRCDGPVVRRQMELEILPLPGGAIEFRSHLAGQEPRDPVPLLDPAAPRGDALLTACSWCRKVLLDDRWWVEVEEAVVELRLFDGPLPRLSHGVCEACAAAMRSRLRG